MMKYHAYLFVDGSSSRHEDIGAWTAVACCGDNRKLLWGIDWPTTISRCELKPIIEGLRWIKQTWSNSRGFRVCVYSDSEYTVKTLSGINERGKNLELWAAVDAAASGMNVTYKWRERNSLPYMTFCDGMCGSLRKNMLDVMSRAAKDPRVPEVDMPFYTLNELEPTHEEEDTTGADEDQQS